MTSLTAIFGSTQEDTGDSEKLLELYWNRAELKKEFADLRDETFRLKELIEEKEGVAARAEQKLDNLENLLLDPEWIYNVLVYYHLREFNNRCKNKLARFAEQLKQQREKRQHGRLMQDWHDRLDDEAQDIQSQIAAHRLQMQMLEDQLQAERHRFSMMSGFQRFFRKRSVKNMLDGIAANIEASRLLESELLAALERVQSCVAPDTQGLDVASKRSINFMILSFAQQVYLHFSEDGLSGLAKESGDKSVGAVKYGTKADCDLILNTVRRHADSMDNLTDFADVLQKRAKLIAEKAMFKTNEDAVPESGTVSTVFAFDENGKVKDKDANLIGENYWDLGKILSR